MRCLIANAAPVPYALKQEVVAKLGDGFLYEVYGSTELGDRHRAPARGPAAQAGFVRQALRRRSRCASSRTTARMADAGRAGRAVHPHRRSRWTATTAPTSSSPSSSDGEWKSVGDVAYVDDEGYLFICDRKKDMIISGGVNIYPAEIEAVLHEHPQVLDVAVFGIPDDEWGETRVRDRPGEAGRDDRPRRAARVRRERLARLQAAARLRGPRRAAAHRRRQAPEARPARRVLAATAPSDGACDAPRPSARTLSEHESKRARSPRHGVPVLDERVVADADAAVDAAARSRSAYPVVVKLVRRRRSRTRPSGVSCGSGCTATTTSSARRRRRCSRAATARGRCGRRSSSRRWCAGSRELIAGVHRDPQFGPCVMLGRRRRPRRGARRRRVPARAARPRSTPRRCSTTSRTQALLGPFRGEPAGRPRRARATCSLGLAALAEARPDVASRRRQPADRRRRPPGRGRRAGRGRARERDAPSSTPSTSARCSSRAASSSRARRAIPASSGSSRCTTSSRTGYAGEVFATNREGGDDPRRRRPSRVDRRAARRRRRPRLRVHARGAPTSSSCARARAKGVRAAFVTSRRATARRGRRAGRPSASSSRSPTSSASCSPARTARASSRRRRRCARRSSRRTRPPVRIGIASQSRQLRVVVPELRACRPGVGVSRAVSAGQRGRGHRARLPRVLRGRRRDRRSALAYVEGVADGRAFFERVRARRRPQAARPRSRAARPPAASAPRPVAHRRARDRRPRLRRHVPPGRRDARGDGRGGVRGRGHLRDPAAAARARTSRCSPPRAAGASSPPTRSPRTATSSSLPLPDDLRAAIDAKLPPRWSRNNPIDLAGGETRDTIPEVLELVAAHPDVDAVVYLGLGIQSNQARLMRDGALLPRPRARAHRRLPRAPGRAVRRRPPPSISDATGKPILTATELAVAVPDNAGPRTVRATGRVCYPSSNRAVTALAHLYRYARWRDRRSGSA